MNTRLLVLTVVGVAAVAGGCAERRLVIESTPPGATVWVNDVEVGRTPLEANFTYYGTYDVRLRLDGFEPVATSAKAEVPWYEFVGADLITEALPTGVTTRIKWNFTLEPALETRVPKDQFESDLITRARTLRNQLTPPAPKPADKADEKAPEKPAESPK